MHNFKLKGMSCPVTPCENKTGFSFSTNSLSDGRVSVLKLPYFSLYGHLFRLRRALSNNLKIFWNESNHCLTVGLFIKFRKRKT